MALYQLIISIILCLAVGFTSSFFTRDMRWYKRLKKPSFNPPSQLFAPVWTILYILMGISLYLLWENNAQLAIILFIIQLALNFAWSFIFFRFHSLFLASIEILLLLAFITWTMIESFKVPTAAFLLIPYLLWVSFATILTFSIYWLNR